MVVAICDIKRFTSKGLDPMTEKLFGLSNVIEILPVRRLFQCNVNTFIKNNRYI